MDNFYNFSDDWTSYIKIKIMSDNSQIFFNKKILIYGLGKSGLSSFNFLRNKNDVYLFDDNPNLKINKSIKKKLSILKNY